MSHYLAGMAVPFDDMNQYPSDLLIKGEARLEGRPKEDLVVQTNGGVSQQVRWQGHVGNQMYRNEIRYYKSYTPYVQNGSHFNILLFLLKLALDASFLRAKFKRIFYLERDNQGLISIITKEY